MRECCKFQLREYDSQIDIFKNLFNFFQGYIIYLELSNSNTDNCKEHNVAENTNRDLALPSHQLEDQQKKQFDRFSSRITNI